MPRPYCGGAMLDDIYLFFRGYSADLHLRPYVSFHPSVMTHAARARRKGCLCTACRSSPSLAVLEGRLDTVARSQL